MILKTAAEIISINKVLAMTAYTPVTHCLAVVMAGSDYYPLTLMRRSKSGEYATSSTVKI